MKKKNLEGKTFGRLTVIKRDETAKRSAWLCECECGKTKVIQQCHLLSGATKSCGCIQKEKASKANKTHGESKTKLYAVWKEMKQRCKNPNHKRFKDYGERGISYFEGWENFATFKAWCIKHGYQEGMTIDRVDNEKGYFPDNCRFVSYETNNRNRRNTAKIEGVPLKEFSEINKIEYKDVHYRYYRLKKQGIEPTRKNVIEYANQLPTGLETARRFRD